MVICLERGADLHMAQLMPLLLTVSCFSKIQIGLPFWYRALEVFLNDMRYINPRFTYLLTYLPAYLGSPVKRAVVQLCVCVRACV